MTPRSEERSRRSLAASSTGVGRAPRAAVSVAELDALRAISAGRAIVDTDLHSRMLARLHRHGWIRQVDQRHRRLRLTRAGEAIVWAHREVPRPTAREEWTRYRGDRRVSARRAK